MALPQTTRQYELPEPGAYTNLEVAEVPVSPPKAQEVLVKVHAVSLQYRDLLVAKGEYLAPADQIPRLVPCSDMAGEILSLGEGVTGWQVGDRVSANFFLDNIYGEADDIVRRSAMGGFCQGVLTQYRTFPSHALVKIPEHLSYEEASTLPCAGVTAYNAIGGHLPVKAGDHILILGTGGVSTFSLQFAVASGATAIVVSSTDEKLAAAAKLGARHLINYNKTPDWEEEVLRITNGAGVEHVIEVGGKGTLARSLKSVKLGGCIRIIGFVSKDASDTNTSDVVLEMISKAIVMRGILVGNLGHLKDMIRLIEANPERTRPFVDKVFTFDQTLDAYAYLDSAQHVGKVVIKVA